MSFELKKFIIDTPLYDAVKVEDISELHMFFNKDESEFDGFNPLQAIETTFRIHSFLCCYSYDKFFKMGGFAKLQIICKRTQSLFEFYVLWNSQTQELMKVGQYPSVADFHTHQVKQYKKVLSPEKLREFTKGIGLAAHGVGIGSFVYLRRIFEYLIQEAYLKAGDSIDSTAFQTARMNDKVEMLKDYLPDFLVEHRNLYSILSLGVHELSETICLEYFDTVRLGIEMILDEKNIELEREEKKEKARKRIANMQSAIKADKKS